MLALGGYAWSAALLTMAQLGYRTSPRPRFGHGAEATVGPYRLLGCYHPSQQNTFTGRLTLTMLDDILARAREIDRGALIDVPRRGGRPTGHTRRSAGPIVAAQ